MGACTFETTEIGRYKNANEAYSEAVEEAFYEEGHDSYNGTISTTDGFRELDTHHRYGSKAWNIWVEKLLDQLDKRDCVCYEIKGTALKKMKERRGYKGKRNVKAYYFFGWAAE
tara:strand:+ start:5381 stop:5722 length:342 start_codon:yes stop_codon:yes gene_type:complete